VTTPWQRKPLRRRPQRRRPRRKARRITSPSRPDLWLQSTVRKLGGFDSHHNTSAASAPKQRPRNNEESFPATAKLSSFRVLVDFDIQLKWRGEIFIGCGSCEACGSFRRTLESVEPLALRTPLAGLSTFGAALRSGKTKFRLRRPMPRRFEALASTSTVARQPPLVRPPLGRQAKKRCSFFQGWSDKRGCLATVEVELEFETLQHRPPEAGVPIPASRRHSPNETGGPAASAAPAHHRIRGGATGSARRSISKKIFF
jgi:hypothetical protein